MQRINGSEIEFESGEKANYDAIIMCTGYEINLDFLHKDIRDLVFYDEKSQFLNVNYKTFIFIQVGSTYFLVDYLKLYKLVFQPKIGKALSFLGFVQPHTGGILPMSEIQARWVVYLMKGKIKLPPQNQMIAKIKQHKVHLTVNCLLLHQII
jgi:hypothetical protein